MVSPGAEGFDRLLVVIFTARKAVFICGETEVMVPDTIVPNERPRVSSCKRNVSADTHVCVVEESRQLTKFGERAIVRNIRSYHF